MSTYISHGKGEENLLELRERAKSGRSTLWTVNPHVVRGDRVIIYLRAPDSALAAVATVVGRTTVDGKRHGWPGFRMAHLRIDRMVDPPFPLTELRRQLPGWGWPRMPQAHAHVPDEFVPQLLRLLRRAAATAASAVDVDRAIETVRGIGAGFGSPEQNRRVEQAAIRFVRSRYAKLGWTVTDRQNDQCGYDLLARRGKVELHLEVKGTRGSEAGFIITRNELDCARSDQAFRLCVVTDALSDRRSLSEYPAKQMEEAFDLTPIAYIGRRKP